MNRVVVESCFAAALLQETMALTKMNWNNTQFDGALPITMRAARQVGEILNTSPKASSGPTVSLLHVEACTKHAHDVRRYYEKEGLEFLKADKLAGPGVRWKTRGKEDTFHRRQIHAGRVLVYLLQADLAKKPGVTRTAVTKFGTDLSTKRPVEFFELAMKVLEEAGVIFLPDSEDGGVGVRLAAAKPTETPPE